MTTRRPNEVTGPNAGGRRQFPIPTPLTARVGQFCRWAAERAMSSQQHNKKDDMIMTHSKSISQESGLFGIVTGAVRPVHTIGATRLKQFIALGAFLGLVSVAQGQGFIGQQVTIGHYLPNDMTVFDGPYAVTVVSGSSDRQLVTPFADRHKGYGVNIEEDRVIIDFIDSVYFTVGPEFHGVIISNLVSRGRPSISETAPHRLFSYAGATLKMDWQDITVPSGATYTITFTSVPRPSLSIARQADAVVLRWPSATTNAVLESTASLPSPGWAPVTNTPILLGSDYVVTNGITSQGMFYRLKCE